MELNKKNLGQYFTKHSFWLKPQVKKFIEKVNPKVIIDPFVGDGDLLGVARSLGFTNVQGFDIDPSLGWEINDSLKSIPKFEGGLIITNPPYLAKNSATKNKLAGSSYFEGNNFQDLYQLAILNALSSCDCSIFIIPETFVTASLFSECIDSITIIEENPFEDTECPICVCCFRKDVLFESRVYDIFKGDLFLFDSFELSYRIKKYKPKSKFGISFNDLKGNLGLRGVDGVREDDRIRFCLPKDLDYDLSKIKVSSRAITLIDVETEVSPIFIERINSLLEDYRMRTHDILLSPFKNNNEKGHRRRRIDFMLARKLINKTIESLNRY